MAGKRVYTREKGAALLFFIAGAMPLFLLFLGLALDLSRLYLIREDAQRAADNAAMVGAKHLPYQDQAKLAVTRYLNQELTLWTPSSTALDSRLMLTDLKVDSHRVEVTLRQEIELLVLSFFSPNANRLSIQTRAAAEIKAKNVMIFMDNSSYMSPAWEVERPWGTNKFWPVAKWVKLHPKLIPPYQDDNYPNRPARIATQQCFNPLFSAVKEAVIRLYDYLGAFGGHAVGIMMGPGQSSNDLLMVRDIMPVNHVAQTSSSVTQNPGEGTFGYFRTPYVRDEYCMAMAEEEPLLVERADSSEQEDLRDDEIRRGGYRIPTDRGSSLGSRTEKYINQVDHALPVNNLPKLTVKDIIWSRAAHRPFQKNAPSDHYVNIGTVLRETGRALLAAPIRKEREGQNYELSHAAFLFLGDLPRQNGVRFARSRFDRRYTGNAVVKRAITTELQRIDAMARELNVKAAIYFVIPRNPHEYAPPTDILDRWYNTVLKRTPPQISDKEWKKVPDHDCVDDPTFLGNMDSHAEPTECKRFFEKDMVEFEEFLKNQSRTFSNLQTVLIRPPDLASIAQDTMAFLPMVNREVVIAD